MPDCHALRPLPVIVALLPTILLLGIAPASAQPSFEEVTARLRHPDPGVRTSGMRALRETRYPEAAGPLAALLSDPVDAIRLEAVDSLLDLYLIDPPRTRKRVALIVEVRSRSRAEAAFHASPLSVLPIGVPPEVVTGLLRAASDPHAGVRFDALHVLSLLAPAPLDATSADRLTHLLGDADPGTRLAATRALGRLQVKTAGEALIHGMNDPDERVRLAAMRAVGELGDERAVQALTERLQYHGRGPAAEAALDGLARIGHSSSEPIFRQHLGDRAPALRRIAAEGLARSANPTLAQELELLRSGERDDSVRLALSFALQRMGQPYLDRLIEPLANVRLAGQSHGYLLELGASPESIRALHSYTRDPDPAIRAVVVDVLGMVGGPPEVTLLEPLRQDPHPMVAAAATRAVSRLQLGLERGAP